jgi:hypothetical protein
MLTISFGHVEYSANRDATELGDLDHALESMRKKGPPAGMSQEEFDQSLTTYAQYLKDPEVHDRRFPIIASFSAITDRH